MTRPYRSSPPTIPYTPERWTPEQRAYHSPADLDAALRAASGLAGGWYLRAVDVCLQVTEDREEHYAIVPREQPPPAGFSKVYRVERLADDDGSE
jgi:hypothetical protein